MCHNLWVTRMFFFFLRYNQITISFIHLSDAFVNIPKKCIRQIESILNFSFHFFIEQVNAISFRLHIFFFLLKKYHKKNFTRNGRKNLKLFFSICNNFFIQNIWGVSIHAYNFYMEFKKRCCDKYLFLEIFLSMLFVKCHISLYKKIGFNKNTCNSICVFL